MADDDFQVDHIDHVALDVPNRYETAQWYEDVLGLTICDEYEMWAERGGPLVISSDGGHTMLALFEGSPGERKPRHIAFRTDGEGFLEFVNGLAEFSGVDAEGRADVVDHDLSFSVYFTDPAGYRLEVTTYEYDRVEAEL
jgi:catechol 2,3-dioxygenase-like lactoylglutathione lyase family enzyme